MADMHGARTVVPMRGDLAEHLVALAETDRPVPATARGEPEPSPIGAGDCTPAGAAAAAEPARQAEGERSRVDEQPAEQARRPPSPSPG